MSKRLLGTMIAYGYPRLALNSELALATSLNARLLEILPDWKSLPDPRFLRREVAARGLAIHSAHGCWGRQTIKADRVDLASTEAQVLRESIEDVKRCVDWLHAAGGRFMVVHPGGLSSPAEQGARTEALARALTAIAEHATESGVVVCVENMPPGVHPGSRMEDLHGLLSQLQLPQLALALDTGHAHLAADLPGQTLAAGQLLMTTHVHDNDGRQDSHDPPGKGTIDWAGWVRSLDEIGYTGPVILECIRQIRSDPSLFDPGVLTPLLTVRSRT